MNLAKRILLCIGAGALSLTLAGCYGTVMYGPPAKLAAPPGNDKPVAGLETDQTDTPPPAEPDVR